MKFYDVFIQYLDENIKNNPEARSAVEEFNRHIPARILQMEFDPSRSNKQGVKDGVKVFKLGLDLASATAFVEYYDNYGQDRPSMAMYSSMAKRELSVIGNAADRRFIIRFSVVNGKVVKTVQR